MGESLQHGGTLSQSFNHLQKICSLWPHTHRSWCVGCTVQGSVWHRDHTFQHTEQAHTCLLSCPKPQLARDTGASTHTRPATQISSKMQREGRQREKASVQGLKERNFVNRSVSPGVFNCQEKKGYRVARPWPL